MTNTILITGGAGFIGSHLASALLNRGYRVRVLDILSPQIHGHRPESSPLYRSLSPEIDFRHGNVTDPNDMREALGGVDVVVHLAAETGTGQSMYDIGHYTGVNVGGTALLMDTLANERLPIRRLVVASSRAVYGEGKYHCPTHGEVFPLSRNESAMLQGNFELECPVCYATVTLLPTDENSPLRPASVYAVTKLAQEHMALTVGKALGISTVAFRYQNVYGPGQALGNPYTGILSIFSTRIRNGQEINIFEDGLESRDFVYIDDVVQATIAGIEATDDLHDVFNVGSGVATSVSAVADLLQDLMGVRVQTKISRQFRMGDIRHNVADLARIRFVLGYTPKIEFSTGLKRFVEWVQSVSVGQDRYEESLDELRAKGLLK
jgi:dTDP-L-rhamnose 4-epimerase